MGKKKDVLKRLDPKKESKKILEIKKIVNSLLLNKKEKKIIDELLLKAKHFMKTKKLIKDVYRPIKISGAFSNNFVEYKSDSKKDKSISIAEYLNNIREYLRKLIDDKSKNGEWKIQLVMKIILISSKNFIETRDMQSKSDNFEIMIGVDINEIIKNLFDSFYKDI